MNSDAILTAVNAVESITNPPHTPERSSYRARKTVEQIIHLIFLLCGIGCVGALKLAGASFGQWEISIVWGLAVAMGVYVCGGVCVCGNKYGKFIYSARSAGFNKRN